jgi:hypothetical protein
MRSLVSAFALVFLAFAACQGEPSQEGAGSPNQTTVQAIGTPDSGPGPGNQCVTAADCRLFSDYCGGCTCRALPNGVATPVCRRQQVACFVDPCGREAPACENGYCVARNGGSALE